MAWLILLAAGLLEVVWAYMMKQSDGLSRPFPAVVMLAAMIASFALLAISMKTLPLGTAYAVWTGIGTLGAFLLGVLLLGEAAGTLRLASAGLILLGMIGMKAASAG